MTKPKTGKRKQMEYPEIDRNGYPTEDTLEEIQFWPYECGFKKLLEFVTPLFSEYGRCEFRSVDDAYEVSTGGWSGCEDVIQAMSENHVFWGMCWMQSKRGGHYEFKIK